MSTIKKALAIGGVVLGVAVGVTIGINWPEIENRMRIFSVSDLPVSLQYGSYGMDGFPRSTNLPGYNLDFMLSSTMYKRSLQGADITITKYRADKTNVVEFAHLSRNILGGWGVIANTSIPGSPLSKCLKDGKTLNKVYAECKKEVGVRDTLSLPERNRHPYLAHWE